VKDKKDVLFNPAGSLIYGRGQMVRKPKGKQQIGVKKQD